MNKFNVGDVVTLKSGGPKMTVGRIVEDGEAYRCQWFAGKKLEYGQFPEDSLLPAEDEAGDVESEA